MVFIEVNFYQSLPSSLNKTICKLVEKSYNTECNTVIVINKPELLDEIDKLLWTYSRKIFLPHATKNDSYHELQPIYITDFIENPNNSKLLFLINPITISRNMFDLKFERIFIIDENEEFIQKNINILSMLDMLESDDVVTSSEESTPMILGRETTYKAPNVKSLNYIDINFHINLFRQQLDSSWVKQEIDKQKEFVT